MADSVQTDLGLSDKQKTQLRRLEQSMRQKVRDTFEASREEGMDPDAMRSTMNGIRRGHDAAVSKVLDSARSALSQIELQREGLLAVATIKEVATKLKLTARKRRRSGHRQ